MSLAEKLKASGFVPTQSTDGEWQPYSGDYICTWATLRKETAKNGKTYWKAEWNIEETLQGDAKRDSKYADLSNAYFFDLADESTESEENLKELLSDAFTFGVELDYSSDDKLAESAANLIGTRGYIHAYAKQPYKQVNGEWVEDTSKSKKQAISIRKMKLAEKKRSASSLSF